MTKAERKQLSHIKGHVRGLKPVEYRKVILRGLDYIEVELEKLLNKEKAADPAKKQTA